MRKLIISILILASGNVLAHGGRADRNGGHTDKKTNTYHCHKEPCFSNHRLAKEATENAIKQNRAFSKLYNRKEWPHWTDDDRDCQNTRAEVLIISSSSPVKFKRNKGCSVSHGEWFDPYTNLTFTQASKLDIDHIVPLMEAHISGASNWTREEKREFANDHENLIAVSANENREKGAKDPANWLPDTINYRCKYVKHWLYVKLKYKLNIDKKEKASIKSVLNGCH